MGPPDSGLLGHHLAFLERISALAPIPFVMGGYAEDALMGEEVTRQHQDVDLVFPRSEIELRLGQLRSLGFETFDTWGENRSGEPFYLAASDGNLQIDVGIYDEDGSDAFIEVGRMFFQLDGRPAPVGYRLHLPEDTFSGPVRRFEGVTLRPISALALYQMRAGFSMQGTFGDLGEKQRRSMQLVRDRLLPNHADEFLAPRITVLS